MSQLSDEIHFCEHHDVVLKVGNKRFFAEKKTLAEKCLYFAAMFSGNFIEKSKDEIEIEVMSSDAMQYFLNYFYYEHDEIEDLDSVSDILEAASYLQIPYFENVSEKLLCRINAKTWCKILQIAKYNNLSNVETVAKFYGLCKFGEIRNYLEYISDFDMLIWYLSHVNLKALMELDVFMAGCDWLKIHKYEYSNSILSILNCLNYQYLDSRSLNIILENDTVNKNSFAVNIIKSIMYVMENFENVESELINSHHFKDEFCKRFDSNTYQIVCDYLISPRKRIAPEKPCIAGKIGDRLYLLALDLENKQLTKWLDIGDGNMWGCNIVSWNTHKILILCGETNKGRNIWNKEIKMYNCLEKKWTTLNSVPVKPRRHCACVIHNDNVYLIGGVGNYRIPLKSVVKYNLIDDSWETLPDLPEHCQLPVATFHKNELYVSAQFLYVFRNNTWVALCQVSRGHSTIFSYMEKIHFTRNWGNSVYVINTETISDVSDDDRPIKVFKAYVLSMCMSGNHLYCFTTDDQFGTQIQSITICQLDNKDVHGTETIKFKQNLRNVDFNTTPAGCLCVPNFEIHDISINNYEEWLIIK